MHIGQYQLDNNLILAPMAGVTDRPFRELCREQGAGLAVSEMLSSNPRVWNSTKSRLRMDYHDESGILEQQAEELISVYGQWFDMDAVKIKEEWARLSGIKHA